MKLRQRQIYILIASLILGLASASYAYIRGTENYIQALELDTYDVLIQTERFLSSSYRDRSLAIENQLKSREQELEAKKAELDKISAELAVKIKELNAAQSQLSANASELSRLRGRPPLFVFNVESSSVQNIEQKKEDIKQIVTGAYDVIEQIYSQPYLLSSVTISFVDSFSNPNAAAEITITNSSSGLSITIKLKDFDKNDFNDVNAILHEIVHSFHGLAVLDPVAYEEGITVAATDVVMEQLIAQGKIPAFNPLYIRISQSDYETTTLTLPRNSSQFYSSANTGDYYQLASYGWYQIYRADNNFFKTFNEKIYTEKRQGKEITESLVLELIKASTNATVQGQSITNWVNTKAFVLN